MDTSGPASVSSVKELSQLLQRLRTLRADRMSYEKMSEAINREISRSELGRIFAGEDFPLRKQLHVILKVLQVGDDELEPWNEMWTRLAQDHYGLGEVVENPNLTPRRDSAGRDSADGSLNVLIPAGEPSDSRQGAAAIIDDALAEADRIVRSARNAAEEQGRELIDQAQATASRIMSTAAEEQAALIRSAESRIADAFGAAEERLRLVMAGLSESVENTNRTTEELRRLVEEVRTSVVDLRQELTNLKAEPEMRGGLYWEDPRAAPPVIDYGPANPSSTRPPWH